MTFSTVIYDGNCGFCKSCVEWVKSRVEINAEPNQSVDLNKYGLTRDQVDKSVVVIADGKTLFGARAVAKLLKISGWGVVGYLLQTSGPIGEMKYRYVAGHRNGLVVKILHKLVKATIKK